MDFKTFLVQKQKEATTLAISLSKKAKRLNNKISYKLQKPDNLRKLRIFSLLVFLSATLACVRIAEASSENNKTTQVAPVEQQVADNQVTEPSAPVAEAQTPAPVVESAPVAPAPAPVKTTPKPKAKVAPKITAPKPASSDNSVSTSMTQSGILSQINYQRRANGLGNTTLNAQLSSAALAKAKHMADNNYFAHTAPDGTTDFDFVKASGYSSWTSAGVNLAMGDFGDARGLVDAWMNSAGHRANILAAYGKIVGIGIYGKYFVTVIAN